MGVNQNEEKCRASWFSSLTIKCQGTLFSNCKLQLIFLFSVVQIMYLFLI